MVASHPLPPGPAELADASARPEEVRHALSRLLEAQPRAVDQLTEDPALAHKVVTLMAASRHLSRVLETDGEALDVLGRLDHPPPLRPERADDLARWRNQELVRLAARDLTGESAVEDTAAAISEMAVTILQAALDLVDAGHLALVAMGKLGGRELNWSSDVDVMVVGTLADEAEQRLARRALEVAGRALRVDTDLRPEGRDGALVRTVAAYETYWERWARPWELQALLRSRPVAGDGDLGESFATAAEQHLWDRSLSADDLRELRDLKRRAEKQAVRLGDWEIKSSPGGIRDVEFAAQLLQLVHGRLDPLLRVRGTLPALTELAAGGYVAADDAEWLAHAYRFLRRIEHALQLVDDRQVHVVPSGAAERQALARVLGWRDGPASSAAEAFARDLRGAQAVVRQVHERWWFRPLLDAFTGGDRPGAGLHLHAAAVGERLAAAGFRDAERTRQAVVDLTRGLTRSSRLMQQLLPVLLDWLSSTPDPDAGLLGLRRLVATDDRARVVTTAFRDSPETARRLCVVLGTSELLGERLTRNPDLLDEVAADHALRPQPIDVLAERMAVVVARRAAEADGSSGLRSVLDRERLRIGLHDVLDRAAPGVAGEALSHLGQAALQATLDHLEPPVPVAVIALGRFGGNELSYASDLDVVLVHGGEGPSDQAAAEATASGLVRLLGRTADLGFAVDLDLRPEGRQGPLVRSVAGHLAYVERWAQPWERLAWVRARQAGGDVDVAESLLDGLAPWRWRRPDEGELRDMRRVKARSEAERVPAGEDPTFHLKLGPGGLNDVELCTQLLQLRHGVEEPSTDRALERLGEIGALTATEVADLLDSHRFCVATRDRWYLVGGRASDALPAGEDLVRLARSLGTTGPDLRDEFRRVTRRARRVVERHFYAAS